MTEMIREMTLKSAAKRGGGDRYTDNEGFDIYLPQWFSRGDTGQPAREVFIVVTTQKPSAA